MDRRSFLTGSAGALAVAAFGGTEFNTAFAAVASNLQPGSRGAAVKALQNRLNQLGYWCGSADGVYGALTTQAVLAVQKASGIGRDGVCGRITAGKINSGFRPSARSRSGGRHIEIDKNRQIVMLVENGSVKNIFNTSTGDGRRYYAKGLGNFRATTPSGTFHVGRRNLSGWETGSLGPMYKPAYFNGAIALHGSPSIPAYPASHGCCRLSTSAMDYVISHGWTGYGATIMVY